MPQSAPTPAAPPVRDGPIPVLAITKSTGGLAVYHRALLAGLPRDRLVVHTLCLSDGAATLAAELRARGHAADSCPMARYRIDPAGDLRVLRRTLGLARATRARVILCHGSKAAMIGRVAGWWLGVPAIHAQASLPFLPRVQGRAAPLWRWMERGARLFGGHLVALTEGAARASLAAGVASPAALTVIRTGIDPDLHATGAPRQAARAALGLPEQAPLVLWMGRFERQKAPEVFVAAAAGLCRALPEAQVVIVGEGSLRAALVRDIAALPCRDRIRLLPWQDDPSALMAAADVLCLSSRWEGLPLVLLEAMASGAVPVATAVDGCAEVIEDGQSGRLVPPDDPDALAAALVATLSDPAALARLGAGARARVRRDFHQQRMLAEWTALLERLARRQPDGPEGGGCG